MKRTATAQWRGTGKEGKGKISTQSGVLKEAQYGFNTRFEDGPGTNPEELIGAAHAGCFTMATAFALTGAGFNPEQLNTSASVIMEKQGDAWTITEVQLKLDAKIPEISEAKFQEIAAGAKANCPVSRLLNAKISLEAKLLN